MKITQETKNLFRLTRFGMVNCFLVLEEDGATLIDTNLAGSATAIFKAAQQVGTPIQRIALTHAHIDHLGSLDGLVQLFPKIEFLIGQA
jgi:glyoxylase-like metal-dependent hydrolase (beta-lactamase superfamily II)